jgi:predicted GNAT family acetyltransferase
MKSFKEYLLESEFKTIKVGPSTAIYKEHDDHIEISSVRTPSKQRKQGHAHAVMRAITNIADTTGKKTRLLASPLDKKTSTNKLVAFYRKHDFEVTGEKGNFVGDPWMERMPKHKDKKA